MRYVYENVVVRKRGKLPHWHVANGIYFLTYRLAGSQPAAFEREIALLRARLVVARQHEFHGKSARELEREIFRRTDADSTRIMANSGCAAPTSRRS